MPDTRISMNAPPRSAWLRQRTTRWLTPRTVTLSFNEGPTEKRLRWRFNGMVNSSLQAGEYELEPQPCQYLGVNLLP